MIVRAIATRISDKYRKEYAVAVDYDPEWQVSIGQQYIVFAMDFMSNSMFFGGTTMYLIIDDYDRLLSMPSYLFDVVDARVSKYWVVTHKGVNTSLEPEEFVEDPFLPDKIFDNKVEASKIFKDMKSRFESENE